MRTKPENGLRKNHDYTNTKQYENCPIVATIHSLGHDTFKTKANDKSGLNEAVDIEDSPKNICSN